MPPEILGLGIDLCELDRMQRLLEKMGDRFLHRAYTAREIEYIGCGPSAARRCAAVFAGKEAVVKCLGTGFSEGIGWRQVEIAPHAEIRGAWHVSLSGEAARRAAAEGTSSWSVDIHVSRDHAAAIALWSRTEEL
jgi:holo-[acyl-carrier protein] synthase